MRARYFAPVCLQIRVVGGCACEAEGQLWDDMFGFRVLKILKHVRSSLLGGGWDGSTYHCSSYAHLLGAVKLTLG